MKNPKSFTDALRKHLQRQFISDFPNFPVKVSVRCAKKVAGVSFYDVTITNNPFRKGKRELTLATLQQEQNYLALARDQYQNNQNQINKICFKS